MRRVRPLLIPALVMAALLPGCADGPPFGDVQGEVTLDGQPVREGVVRFTPVDGKTGTASALIANGTFRERVPVGTHRVEISAPQLPKGVASSQQMKRGTIDENVALKDLIPERYNVRSDLTMEVQRGDNKRRFDLKSK